MSSRYSGIGSLAEERQSAFAKAVVVVVGDAMLDAYIGGEVSRISPEAPVPVLRHTVTRETAGGAANVALNVAGLGAQARLIALVGDDEEGRRIRTVMSTAGVISDLIVDERRPTITKTRVLAGAHQLVRIDREERIENTATVEAEILRRAEVALVGAGALILSDYGKGCLSDHILRELIAMAKRAGVAIFVDPKRVDLIAYRGADYIKPNRSELFAATGLSCDTDLQVGLAARKASAATGSNILVTRSEQGMALYTVDGEETLLGTEAVEVFDVSGAGDTVIATFAISIACGMTAVQSMRLANAAASVVVAKAGTAVVTIAELNTSIAALDDHDDIASGVLVSWDQAVAIRDNWRAKGLEVGLTNGCFDLLHPGHIALLSGAADYSDRLIVALNTDRSVSRLKGPTRPIQNEQARARVVGAIRGVDLVVLFDEETPRELIETLLPDVLVKGADYEVKDIVGADLVLARGGRVERIDIQAGHSTTGLVARSRS